jgi:hypothetical protein
VASLYVLKGDPVQYAMEVGWIECKWDISAPCNNNNRVVFVYDTAHGTPPHFFTNYPLILGQHYDFAIQYPFYNGDATRCDVGNTWAAFIWWNGNWELLWCHTFSVTEMTRTWQNWEIYEADEPPAPTWNVPTTWFGSQVTTKIMIKINETQWGWQLWEEPPVLTWWLNGPIPPPNGPYDAHLGPDNKYYNFYGHKH